MTLRPWVPQMGGSSLKQEQVIDLARLRDHRPSRIGGRPVPDLSASVPAMITRSCGVGAITVTYEVRLRLRNASVSRALVDDEVARSTHSDGRS